MKGGWLRVIGALGALLAGCTVGPDYKQPAVATPSAYKEVPPTGDEAAGIWRPARPEDGMLRGNWWEVFGDGTLDALEDQVTAANQTLKQAEANFRQARALIGLQQANQYPTLAVEPSIQSLKDSGHQPYFVLKHPTPTGEYQLPLDLSYEVDLWGQVRRSISAAREEAQATSADLATASLSLHAELAIDYVELRSADAQQKLLDDTVAAFADALKLTEDRLAGGGASEADVAQARTQLETTRSPCSSASRPPISACRRYRCRSIRRRCRSASPRSCWSAGPTSRPPSAASPRRMSRSALPKRRSIRR
jgi:outer membrane protein TolC